MKDFRGCGTALVTPFIDYEVDYEAYVRLVDRQVEEGADFLVALATTGETPALTSEEKKALLKLTYAHAAGKPVMVGCGSNSVAGTLANISFLDGPEVDAWLVVVPFYNKPTQEGMFLYYKAIAENTDKPVFIYNVPGRTGANLLPQTCIRIAREIPGIAGIKEASGNLEQAIEILKSAPEGFSVLSGDDDLTLEMIRHGAAGVISVASNITPSMVGAMTSYALEGRFPEAEEIGKKLSPLFKACFVESNPIPVKAGLEALGLMTAQVRLPLTEATAQTRKIMKELVDSIN